MNPLDLNTGLCRVGEGNRLRLTVARIIARHQELDADSVLRVAQMLASGERGNVSQALQVFVDLAKALARYEDINVLGKAPDAVEEQRHAADDGIRDAQFVQPPA